MYIGQVAAHGLPFGVSVGILGALKQFVPGGTVNVCFPVLVPDVCVLFVRRTPPGLLVLPLLPEPVGGLGAALGAQPVLTFLILPGPVIMALVDVCLALPLVLVELLLPLVGQPRLLCGVVGEGWLSTGGAGGGRC